MSFLVYNTLDLISHIKKEKNAMLKNCSKCNEEKEHPKDFHKGNVRIDGSNGFIRCKKCYNEYSRKYRLKSGRTKTQPHDTPNENLVGRVFVKLPILKYMGKKQYKYNTKHDWLCYPYKIKPMGRY